MDEIAEQQNEKQAGTNPVRNGMVVENWFFKRIDIKWFSMSRIELEARVVSQEVFGVNEIDLKESA
jgi:hypothetical protein